MNFGTENWTHAFAQNGPTQVTIAIVAWEYLDAQTFACLENIPVNPPDHRWKETVQRVFEQYTAAVQKMNDDVLIGVHRQNVRLHIDDLAEITKAELERRKLPIH